MIAILKKEINTFFSSPVGYLVIGVFLTLNGLFLFLFKGDFNILDTGIGSLTAFFELTPWILIFLVPAVTMRSFSDETKQGTLELLLTKPISVFNLVLGKFLGSLSLVLMALIPTLLYVVTLYQLSSAQNTIDLGSIIGSYFGLMFLIMAYTAIGVFTSSLTSNQIVAFISAVCICFLMYFGFEGLSEFNPLGNSFSIDSMGMLSHFKSISRGVLDSRDLIYFLSVSGLFLVLTKINLSKK
ncbi:gliding motility-associated ABC transporter permease subunit GldF [Winogradskyella aurantiaca]|uniref:gliding motility-associated ABC transporter permease subunit GldF n=1 Tax=Winogradskyella aurantiaca TaxID=2219558 RepID=UPI000E1C9E47|nr:gliding motility-associated ABC transporter permease subunit GldF [Winogradskyella aurantiaca]